MNFGPAIKNSAKGSAIKKLITAIIQATENAIISVIPTIKIIGFQIFRMVVKTVESAFTMVEMTFPSSEIPFLRAFRGAFPLLPNSPALFFLKKIRHQALLSSLKSGPFLLLLFYQCLKH